MPIQCRVCRAEAAGPFMEIAGQAYWRCGVCAAVFLDAAHLPSAEAERARYLLHENDPRDPGYRSFLNRLADPLLQRLKPRREGLDYGCGPGPALAQMLTEAGHVMRLYDPFFHDDASALERTYDFITCTEAVEHFHFPARDFDRLNALLRPGGWLGIMTSFLCDTQDFARWHYRQDPTHVVFYHENTLRHLADHYGWHCEFPAKGVALMHKRGRIEE